jgi:hypothetical protein
MPIPQSQPETQTAAGREHCGGVARHDAPHDSRARLRTRVGGRRGALVGWSIMRRRMLGVLLCLGENA